MGTVNGRTYAFVGLERIGGVMICDITDPSSIAFRNYVNSRNYSADIYDDVSPEGVIFVAAEQNISGAPLVIASNEVSGTVSVTAPDMTPRRRTIPASRSLPRTSRLSPPGMRRSRTNPLRRKPAMKPAPCCGLR